MCMVDWAEAPEFFKSRESRCRKAQKCGDCGRVIAVGETYHYASGKSDGEFWTAKVCVHCDAAGQWLIEECGGYCYGQILEDLEEHLDERSWPDPAVGARLARAIVGIRKKWTRRNGRLMRIPSAPRNSASQPSAEL